jgi:hypothetical protein
MINNLFDPKTIDESYLYNGQNDVLGIKDKDNNWNKQGHSDRIISVDDNLLKIFAQLSGDPEKYHGASLLALHCRQLKEIVQTFGSNFSRTCATPDSFFFSSMWNETNSQKDGIITKRKGFLESPEEIILSGPNVGLANPLFQSAKLHIKLKNDYDIIDLNNISNDYYPLTKYQISKSVTNDSNMKLPKLSDGSYFEDSFRVIYREMIGNIQERTLICSLIPPKFGYIHVLTGLNSTNLYLLLLLLSFYSSLIYDFIIKILNRKHFSIEIASSLPIISTTYDSSLIIRSLLLNCLISNYQPLWKDSFSPTFQQEKWAKVDSRLSNSKFSALTSEWTWDTPLRTDYERRQALVEIDVLASMALGLTLEQLKTAYSIQFPVLKQTEAGTFYDQRGRVVFSTARSLAGVGLERAEWEHKKDNGKIITRVVTENTKDGPRQRTIEYVPPFDKCDREKDYETAWAFFTEKFAKKDKD